jgi:flagellar hook-length control protein FliK
MAASPEAAIAETVTYWAAQGIQNAELKLDAWGGQALEVSISMNGNQAEVEFRTDQSEIRQIIEGAMPQLKDMLAEEGLILSGVAVGASGNQSSDTPGRRPPQGSRQLRVSQAEDEVATVHRRSGSGVGQALDLFV